MKYAFTKAKRLLKKEEYERVFKQPNSTRKIETNIFFVLSALNDKHFARIGFALSKKNLPQASLRNRVKRLFREDFRINSLTIKNVDIIVLAKPGLKKSSDAEIRKNLLILWKKIAEIYPV